MNKLKTNPTLYGDLSRALSKEYVEPISTITKIAKALGVSSNEVLK